jgi:hypothetical protein
MRDPRDLPSGSRALPASWFLEPPTEEGDALFELITRVAIVVDKMNYGFAEYDFESVAAATQEALTAFLDESVRSVADGGGGATASVKIYFPPYPDYRAPGRGLGLRNQCLSCSEAAGEDVMEINCDGSCRNGPTPLGEASISASWVDIGSGGACAFVLGTVVITASGALQLHSASVAFHAAKPSMIIGGCLDGRAKAAHLSLVQRIESPLLTLAAGFASNGLGPGWAWSAVPFKGDPNVCYLQAVVSDRSPGPSQANADPAIQAERSWR